MKAGCTGSVRSKNLMSNGKVVSLPGGQAWITELQRNASSIKRFLSGQIRSSRDVTPTGWPAAFGTAAEAGISPTTVGLLGSVASRIRIPGWTCGQLLTSPEARGSPAQHRLEPAVRLPT